VDLNEPADQSPVEAVPRNEAWRLATLERLGHDLFRNRFSEFEWSDHLFGGQVLAQALAAAGATVERGRAHSLHGYFLAAGSASTPTIFRIERTRDGGRFCTRRVTAVQGARTIFHMECSFHTGEDGFAHQAEAVSGERPDTLPTLAEAAASLGGSIASDFAGLLNRFRLIDVRLTDPGQLIRQELPARRRIWLRVPSAKGSEHVLVQQALLAYASDFWLAGTALIPHPEKAGGAKLFVASLDHAMWLHAPHAMDEWLSFDTESPWAGDGRGLSTGQFRNEAGSLIATVAQESLIRFR